MKKIIALMLAFALLLSGCSGKNKIALDHDFTSVIEDTLNATYEAVPNPEHNHIYGEWSVLDAIRSGREFPDEWYDIYYENLCKTMKEANGVLSTTKSTTYSRVILALTALGKDITNVAGYNLLDNYMEMKTVTKQGIPGAIFTLIAFDCGGYEAPEGSDVTRENLINYILEREFETGGWAIIGNEADVDITAQVLQALAPYRADEKVNAAVERALAYLSEVQNKDGGFFAWEGVNSQTSAQVIIALTALGIDVRTDERFIKGSNWIGSFLMKYYLGNGQFEHTLDRGYDPYATDHCLEALLSIERFDNGKTSFYDFSDVR